MLNGMIPAAFFATLLRRYLDTLTESPEYVASSAKMGYIGPSALIATAGLAVYGIRRLTNRKTTENKNIEEAKSGNLPPHNKPSSLRIEKRPKKGIRKHYKRDQNWFLKNMKHYKSKYGRRIGKLLNQLLGIPFSETPSIESIDVEDFDDANCSEVNQNTDNINSTRKTDFTATDKAHHNDNKTSERNSSGDSPPANNNDLNFASKDHFDDDETEVAEESRRRSSSLDLKDLLRENFERQMMSKTNRDNSSEGSRRPSKSHRSSTNRRETNRRSRSSSTVSSHKKTHRRRRVAENHGKHKRRSRSAEKFTKKTRSGRYYDKHR